MKNISKTFSFEGKQLVCSHQSLVNNCEMTFAVFIPPKTKNPPVLWYLSGLTCSHLNVMEKGEYRKKATELGMAMFVLTQVLGAKIYLTKKIIGNLAVGLVFI